LIAGFNKLERLRHGIEDEVKAPAESPHAAAMALGSAAREKPFDCLPLHIQAWAMENRKRCRGGE